MTKLETQIHAVTVFPDRAQITRKGKLDLDVGIHKIEIANLPLHLDPDSVRASARGSASAKLHGVDVRKTYYKEIPQGTARALNKQIQTLEDQDRALNDRADSIRSRINHLDGIAGATNTFAKSLSKGHNTVDSHAEILEFLTKQRNLAQDELREIEVNRRDLQEELQKLRKELQGIQNAKPRERYTAFVEVEIVSSGDLTVDLKYMSSGASWKPLYDVRLTSKSYEITYMGQVVQTTGEDWHEIALTLSTAYPSLALIKPELQPWYVAPYPPAKPMQMQARAVPVEATIGAPAPVTTAEKEEPQAPPVQKAEVRTAQVAQKGASVTYRVGDGIDIPGDGSSHKVTIAEIPLSPEQDYVTAPKLADAAYRRVKSLNDSQYMLLPGSAQLFEEDDYMGTTKLDLTAPGQDFELYFGIDDRIRVKRELVRRETDKKFLGDRGRIRFGYELELQNHTDKPQKISVEDQFPVSRHEDIKVRLEKADPEFDSKDELNRLVWNLNLDKGEETKIRFDFSIEYPRNMNIHGLP